MYLDFFTFIIPVLVVATIVLQLIATKRIFKDSAFEPEQRRAQMWFIWLVPIFGAATVLAILHEEPTQRTNPEKETIARLAKSDRK